MVDPPEGMSPEGARIADEMRRARRRTRWINAVLIASGVLFLLFAVYVLATIKESRAASTERDAAIAAIQEELKTVCRQSDFRELSADGKERCRRAERNELPPEVEVIIEEGPPGPEGPEGPAGPRGVPGEGDPGEQGPRGRRGPAGADVTPAMVATAVDEYCGERGDCQGPRGPGPTSEQVTAAVEQYCARESRPCRGEQGPAGSDGEDAPPPTQGQVNQAVAAYCDAREDNCRGPRGQPGEDGEDGSPPHSWTWTDPGSSPTEHDDTTYTCTRDPDSSDDKPTYECTRSGE